jgi:cyclase
MRTAEEHVKMIRKNRQSSRGRRVTVVAAAAALLALCGFSILARAQQGADPKAQDAVLRTGFASDGEVHILHVQGNVYMLVGAGGNITVQAGDDGVLVVDTGVTRMSDKVLAAIKSISDKPIRYIINTSADSDHTGGNEPIAKAGSTIAGGNVVGDIGASAGNQATVISAQDVLDRMSAPTGKEPPTPQGAWPTDTFTTREKKLYFNGEPIEIIHEPSAHTDGDSVVFFHKSDVVSTGDIFVTEDYPAIDLARGGSIQGELNALVHVIDLTTVIAMQEGGTMVIPGHGRLCDQADVVFYQEMVTIIRDRIQDMVKKGMTIDQVQAANPTLDYDPRYRIDTGPWTTRMFIEAVYNSLKQGTPAEHGQ